MAQFVTDERGGVTVLLDGHPQSYVDPNDPGFLAFEYQQQFGIIVDTQPGGPLRVTHAGGAGLTLPRYIQHTRPGSPQIVLEPDAALTEQVRVQVPLPRGHRIRIRPLTGEVGIAQLKPESADLIVVDAFAEGRVPPGLTTADFFATAADKAPLLTMNLADEPDWRYLSRVLAGAATAFDQLVLLSTKDTLKRRRYGNVVLVASNDSVNVSELQRRSASAPVPTGALGPKQVAKLAASARPFSAADAQPSPPPPDPGQWRLR
ncbi:spermidine synthase [Branchiibius sp. NY16-3462-2]|uniref:spermidine synthase n=1 Tax=Branchiibius sp. NY16-3462-2 TaxID=1807500 RepID=UPI0025C290BA|nr:fused MFS/spermidine synthase [Branchiibius sp. NY16-3462-2]